MNEPAFWMWEDLTTEIFRPCFDSDFTSFTLERRADLSLSIVGKAYGGTVRDQRLQDHVPGTPVERCELQFEGLTHIGLSAVASDSVSLGHVSNSTATEPTVHTGRWVMPEFEVRYSSNEPSTLMEWVLNADFLAMLPESTVVRRQDTYTRQQGALEWSAQGGGSSDRYDHLCLPLAVGEQELTVRVGKASGGPTEYKPGFILYENACPDVETRRLVRRALSLALGCRLFPVGHATFDDDGRRILARFLSVNLGTLTQTMRCGTDPMTDLRDGPGHRSAWLSADKVQGLVQGLLDADGVLGLDGLSGFYFQARRSVLDIRALLWGSTIEYIRDRLLDSSSNVLIDKTAYKRRIRPALKEALKGLINEEDLQNGAQVEDLLGKFNYFHTMTLADQARQLMRQQNLEFGDVELAALRERNTPAHGRTYENDAYPNLLRHVRASQALTNRLILSALASPPSTYIDYSTNQFPERQLRSALGGPNGDGEPVS